MNQSVPRFTLPFLVLTVLFCVCLIVSNLIEIKTVDIGFATITAGMVVFPLSYIINDCIVEVYGFRKARTVIWLGFAMNLLVTLFLQFAILLPGADSWQSQDAMEAVYGTVPRILGASFVAFLCGSMYICSYYKKDVRKLLLKFRSALYRYPCCGIFQRLPKHRILFPPI